MNHLLTIDRNAIKLGMYATISLVLTFTSCISKSPFLTSSVIPAAQGSVVVKRDKNQNYNIELMLEHLAQASRLNPPKQTYVIWMESDGKTTKNIGQINTPPGSNSLKASFDTSSSIMPNLIYLTAEDDGTTSYPTGPVVLTTGRLKGDG